MGRIHIFGWNLTTRQTISSSFTVSGIFFFFNKVFLRKKIYEPEKTWQWRSLRATLTAGYFAETQLDTAKLKKTTTNNLIQKTYFYNRAICEKFELAYLLVFSLSIGERVTVIMVRRLHLCFGHAWKWSGERVFLRGVATFKRAMRMRKISGPEPELRLFCFGESCAF